jgi:hypothetical protein
MKKRIRIFLFTITLTLSACSVGATPAPTVDVNAINTAALATAMAQISAQQTMTALAAPSATPLPTNTALALATAGASPTGGAGVLPTVSFNTTPNTTPLAGLTPLGASPAAPAGPTVSLGDACNNSSFEADITIPDGSVLEPGRNFEKIWRVKNTGSCTWDEGYALIYVGGSNPNLDPRNYEFGRNGDSDFVTGGESFDFRIELTTPCTPGKYEGHWRMRNDQGFYFGTTVSVYVEVKERCR